METIRKVFPAAIVVHGGKECYATRDADLASDIKTILYYDDGHANDMIVEFVDGWRLSIIHPIPSGAILPRRVMRGKEEKND